MLSRLYNMWHIARNSFWSLPALICFFYAVLTAAMLWIDIFVFQSFYIQDIALFDLFYKGSVQGAIDIINVLLSAMITMTTLAVSSMMVVLSLAASQLGPRLIINFISSRKTQICIGMFFGAVIGCFILAGLLHNLKGATETPRLSVSLIFILCFSNLFVLLVFINHMAEASIADNAAHRVSQELMKAIDRLTVKIGSAEKPGYECGEVEHYLPDDFMEKSRALPFLKSGYVQDIDYERLVKIAQENDLLIKVDCKAGYYVLEGEELIHIKTPHTINAKIEDDIQQAFILGVFRTPTQDLQYSVRHLVEIGLRALSSGINDHYTAMTVIDKLSGSLVKMFSQKKLPNIFRDKNGHVRILGEPNDTIDIVMSAFSQIRHASAGKPDIIMYLLNKIGALGRVATTADQKRGLESELIYIKEDIEHYHDNSYEARQMHELYNQTRDLLL